MATSPATVDHFQPPPNSGVFTFHIPVTRQATRSTLIRSAGHTSRARRESHTSFLLRAVARELARHRAGRGAAIVDQAEAELLAMFAGELTELEKQELGLLGVEVPQPKKKRKRSAKQLTPIVAESDTNGGNGGAHTKARRIGKR